MSYRNILGAILRAFTRSLPVLALAASFLVPSGSLQAAPRKAAKRVSAKPAAPAPAPLLDTGAVRRYYLDGDFDPAIGLLETSLKTKTGFNHDDSVFIFKHLGVMYAAKYETREKGKHYMHRLLEVEPTVRILDMYASDMIYMIFKNIQDEFEAARDRRDRADARLAGGHPDQAKEPAPQPKDAAPGGKESPKQGSSSAYYWIGATATLAVAAGVAGYFYFSDEPETVVHTP